MALKNIHPMKWVIWFLGISFYFYEFFIRVFPTVMIPDLMKAFALDAGAIGAMSAFYFYIYAPMQIPIGGLMDRYGARKLLTFATLFCAGGVLLFALAPNVWILDLARFLMGFGSAFAFVGFVYISSHWFPPKKLALLVGIGNAIGMLGAVFGEGPLSILVENIGWRQTLFILALIGLALAAIIFLVVRNEPKEMSDHPKEQKRESVNVYNLYKIVLANPQTWLNAIGGFFIYATVASFAGLWADDFLQVSHGLSAESAAFASSMVYLGMVFGSPVMGHLSDVYKTRKPFMVLSTFAAAILLAFVIFSPWLSETWIFIAFFIIGLLLAVQVLNYPFAIDNNPSIAKGTATSFTNFFVISSGVVFQPLVGWLLDLGQTKAQMAENIYTAADYQFSMFTFPITLLLATLFFLMLKEQKKA